MPERHWHAYSYTGHQRPPDREARDLLSPTPPLVIKEWLQKPRAMLAGTFDNPADAVAWLEAELAATPPMSTALPTETVIEYARARISESPGDQVTRYYTAGSYVCRDLVLCVPEPGPCPNYP